MCCHAAGPGRHGSKWMRQTQKTDSGRFHLHEEPGVLTLKRGGNGGFGGLGSEGKRWGVKGRGREFLFCKMKNSWRLAGWTEHYWTIQYKWFKMVNFMLHYFGTIKTKNNRKIQPFSSLFLSLFPFIAFIVLYVCVYTIYIYLYVHELAWWLRW